jgi:hypothetical protein
MQTLSIAMKWLFLLILISNHLNAQYSWLGVNKHISFTKLVPVNEDSDVGIDWEQEKPISEFILEGKKQLSCRVELLNDSTAILSQKVNNKWKRQDKFEFGTWQWLLLDEQTISQFSITDFDHDGDEDLVCWIFSNVNGNEWTSIYINDGVTLIKLYNSAEKTDIWDAPKYDTATKTISTELYSGAYGVQNTATYKLDGSTVSALLKKEHDLTKTDVMVNNTYHGVKGKWKLTETEVEKVDTE